MRKPTPDNSYSLKSRLRRGMQALFEQNVSSTPTPTATATAAPSKSPIASCNLIAGSDTVSSVDLTPWKHPYLTKENITAFRKYSDCIWEYSKTLPMRRPLRIAFFGNMAQNMYKIAKLFQAAGDEVVLIPDPKDRTAISSPEWEDYDGIWGDIFDGEEFLSLDHSAPEVPVIHSAMEDLGIRDAAKQFQTGNRAALLKFLARCPSLRIPELLSTSQTDCYTRLSIDLSHYDVIYTGPVSIPAYLSGRPHCALFVGGDLQYNGGRGDWYGSLSLLSFASARFFTVNSPDAIGHCRRLGLTNAVYCPLPWDTELLSPGGGSARKDWEAHTNATTFILCTARIDSDVKGIGPQLIDALAKVAKKHPEVCFVFLKWGNDLAQFKKTLAALLPQNFLLLEPVGKRRLLDYYRSCDVVLDQLVYGYYGSTGLEAASVGKPIVMNVNANQYEGLYDGQALPVLQASTPDEVFDALTSLISSTRLRSEIGNRLRQWVVEHLGNKEALGRLRHLLNHAALGSTLPDDIKNPLATPLTEVELAYHKSCLIPRED